MKIKNICCIGAGYVGGPTMAVIALKCPDINVTVVDINKEKIDKWNGNLDSLPVYEPGLKEIIAEVRNKNLFFSTKIDEAIQENEMIFIAVNTPTKKEGEGAGMAADLTFVEACAKNIAEKAKSNKIIIEKSTLPVRTAEKIKSIIELYNKDFEFEIISNPEFLAEGSAIQDLFKSDRVLIGGELSESGKKAVSALVEIYERWIPKHKIITTNIWTSELSKLASNAMLAQRISSINSLSAVCEKTGADIDDVSKAIGMDHRIGPHFLKASVGFGGSCFKKDILNLVYLCKYYGLDEVAEFWHQVVKINDYQKIRFAKKIIDYFDGNLKEKNIAILGWAFKANTNDSRESAAIKISEILFKNGAFLTIYDPKVKIDTIKNDIYKLWDVEISNNENKINITKKFSETKQCDAFVIITEWEEFKIINSENSKIIFDGRNINQNKNKISIGK